MENNSKIIQRLERAIAMLQSSSNGDYHSLTNGEFRIARGQTGWSTAGAVTNAAKYCENLNCDESTNVIHCENTYCADSKNHGVCWDKEPINIGKCF